MVEDSPSIRKTMEFVLAAAGFETLSAADGEAALAVIRRARPRVVILDIQLPGLDGVEVCRRVKGDPDLRSTRVIMLTGLGEPADQGRAVAAGADRYVTKPFDEELIVAMLDELMRQ